MYSGTWKPKFRSDESQWKHARERENYVRLLKQQEMNRESAPSMLPVFQTPPVWTESGEETNPFSAKNLSHLLDMISPEDSALVSLIVFLLCDNTENDVVLLGILLYILLSK